MRVISLYSGAGGMDYGFEAAGFETVVALEIDHDCCETLRRNRGWPVIERSIFDLPARELLETASLRPGDADLLIGGPPCQPFSKSGYWATGDSRRLGDPRANTLTAYMRMVEACLPRAFVLENVQGLAFDGKDEGLRMILKCVRDVNRRCGTSYAPHFRVVNAAQYGVPQTRERFFLVASREGREFSFPAPRFGQTSRQPTLFDGAGKLLPYRTAWDALGDLPLDPAEDLKPRGRWAALLPSIPEGHNYLWHTNRGGGLPLFGWRRRYWTFLLKLAKNRPSWTIQAQPGPAIGPFHWRSRLLSMRELCRLQTFPDNVVIFGGRGSIQRQVGNAVPSLLTEVLGRAIRTQLLGAPPLRASLRLLPPRRSPVPPEEKATPVPAEYAKLAGDHSDHPGTGQGFGARARGGPAVA
jgi:DNA (cytosine-5)-methyltransferase 1